LSQLPALLGYLYEIECKERQLAIENGYMHLDLEQTQGKQLSR